MKHLHRAHVRLVLACLAFALTSPVAPPAVHAQQAAVQTSLPATREDPEAVFLTVTVWDKKGASIDGLEKEHFTVLDNGKPREITFFRGQVDEPVSIGVLFDASQSMAKSKTERIRHALSRFMRQSNPENDYFLIAFNDAPQLLSDWTRDADQVFSGLASITPKLNTALYDACYLGIEKIMQGRHPRRVLLLITDGIDTSSRFNNRELTNLLQQSDVMIYGIGYYTNDDTRSLGLLARQGQAVLERLSLSGGGTFYYPHTPEEVDTLFERLAFELRHQYQLGFRPPDDARDGKWHRIKVKVTLPPGAAPPDLKIAGLRTREGYYAAKNRH